MHMAKEDFWDFVDGNISCSPAVLRLKYSGKDREKEITQIECRQKFGKKLAWTLNKYPHFLFPSVISGEQATSDALADFHASLIGEATSIVDLTAGLGIDSSHIAASHPQAKVTAVERDTDRFEALRTNFGDLIHAENMDCIDFLEKDESGTFDIAFIDPARRATDGSRVFALADCEPDITSMLPLLQKNARYLIAKTSPMLDITHLAKELPGIEKIIALGTTTECKELVAIVNLTKEGAHNSYLIEAVTIGKPSLSFTPNEEKNATCEFASEIKAGGYIYEPYPATMKAAPFNILSEKFNLKKLHPNTNLYYSENLVDGFPGEAWPIVDVLGYESKNIKRLKKTYPSIRVTTRNFDMTADALRKKLGVKDGGDRRLFAVTTEIGKMMIIA